MSTPGASAVTDQLRSWSEGDESAGAEAVQRLYQELHRAAAGLFRSERSGHTLQATALVHEAYLRLSRFDRIHWKSRTHFISVAAGTMRRILVDHSREQGAQKRGGDWHRVTLASLDGWAPTPGPELLAVDDALRRLAEHSPTEARIVELAVFAGLTQEEIAQSLGVARKTVNRRWKKARAWLYGELGRELRRET